MELRGKSWYRGRMFAQVFAAGVGAAIAAFAFSKLSQRGQLIAGIVGFVVSVGVVIYAVSILAP